MSTYILPWHEMEADASDKVNASDDEHIGRTTLEKRPSFVIGVESVYKAVPKDCVTVVLIDANNDIDEMLMRKADDVMRWTVRILPTRLSYDAFSVRFFVRDHKRSQVASRYNGTDDWLVHCDNGVRIRKSPADGTPPPGGVGVIDAIKLACDALGHY